MSISSFSNEDILYVIGETRGHLSSSAYERAMFDFEKTKIYSATPNTNLDDEIKISKIIKRYSIYSYLTPFGLFKLLAQTSELALRGDFGV